MLMEQKRRIDQIYNFLCLIIQMNYISQLIQRCCFNPANEQSQEDNQSREIQKSLISEQDRNIDQNQQQKKPQSGIDISKVASSNMTAASEQNQSSIFNNSSQQSPEKLNLSQISSEERLVESFAIKHEMYKRQSQEEEYINKWEEDEVSRECQSQWQKGNFFNELNFLDEDNLNSLNHDLDDKLINQNPDKYPYNCIGLLKGIIPKSKDKTIGRPYVGTGFLISPYLVITAAHNVVDQKRRPLSNIKFYPMLHGEINSHSQEIDVVDIRIPQNYCKNDNAGLDYALVKLGQSVERTKHIMIGQDYPQCTQASIFGYPTGENMNNGKFQQYGGNGEIFRIDEQNIYYKIITKKGQSGSPVIIEFVKGLYMVVGVHSKYSKNLRLNYGCHLSNQKVNIIKGWIEELSPQQKYIVIDFTKIRQLQQRQPQGIRRNYETAPQIELYLKRIRIQREKAERSDCLIWLLLQTAKKLRIRGEYDDSFAYLKQAESICNHNNSQIESASIYFEFGTILYTKKDYQQALEYFQKAKEIFAKFSKRQQVAIALRGIGNCYYLQNNIQLAQLQYKKAYQIDEAFLRASPEKKLSYLNMFGAIQMKKGNFALARQSYNKALKLKINLQQYDIQLWKCYFNIGKCNFKLGEYRESIDGYYQAIKIMIKLKLTMYQKFEKTILAFRQALEKAISIQSVEILLSFLRAVQSIQKYSPHLTDVMKRLQTHLL